jgi:hypothetical protein
MSKKPSAALSANLVAVKGTAAPVPDMPGRASPTMAIVPPAEQKPTPAPHQSTPEPRTPIEAAAGEGGGQPLNFRVPDSFRREFKVFAASHGLKLNELLRLSFEAYRDREAK